MSTALESAKFSLQKQADTNRLFLVAVFSPLLSALTLSHCAASCEPVAASKQTEADTILFSYWNMGHKAYAEQHALQKGDRCRCSQLFCTVLFHQSDRYRTPFAHV